MTKLTQKSLEYKVLQYITANKLIEAGDRVFVACSGGPDSVALLHILLNLKDKLKIKLSVCHYNHRLRGEESDADQKFVEKISKDWGIECVSSPAPKKNLFKNEEQARDARYYFFENLFCDGEEGRIALGHTLSDNVETLLMRLLRGSGLFGATSIPRSRKNFIRPLLSTSRVEILVYLKENSLPYRLDSSNLENNYLRNKIRNKLIPQLSELNPNVEETLNNFIESANLDNQYINEQTVKVYQEIVERKGDKITFNRTKFISLPVAIQYRLIRYCLEQVAEIVDITKKQVDEIIKLIEKGEGKKHKLLPHSLRVLLSSGNISISTH